MYCDPFRCILCHPVLCKKVFVFANLKLQRVSALQKLLAMLGDMARGDPEQATRIPVHWISFFDLSGSFWAIYWFFPKIMEPKQQDQRIEGDRGGRVLEHIGNSYSKRTTANTNGLQNCRTRVELSQLSEQPSYSRTLLLVFCWTSVERCGKRWPMWRQERDRLLKHGATRQHGQILIVFEGDFRLWFWRARRLEGVHWC